MAKFAFPMSFDQFVKAVKDAKVFDSLGGEAGDLDFAYKCLKAGWMSKQYHKDSQGKQQEEIRVIRERMKADPGLKARLLGHDTAKIK